MDNLANGSQISPFNDFNTSASTAHSRNPQTLDRTWGPTNVEFDLEGLPAFPDQMLNMGMEYSFEAEITDPAERAVLMGWNLDPHLTLHHGNENWDYNEIFGGDGI